ncbi:MAG: glycerol-3-phosphate acyltransferase [Acidimicrobiales bacterium]
MRVDRRRPVPLGARRLAAAAAAGYVAGLVPSADVAARVATGGAVDLRRAGSGNPGAVNAMKVLGPKFGYAVLAADIAKGAAGALAGRRVAGAPGAHLGGAAAVIGHCFPATQGFRGGKGVGASVGQCLATFPAYAPIDLLVAATTAGMARRPGRALTATAVSSVSWVLSGLWWWRRRWPNLWGPSPSAWLPAGAAVSSAVILYRFAAAKAPSAEPVAERPVQGSGTAAVTPSAPRP